MIAKENHLQHFLVGLENQKILSIHQIINNSKKKISRRVNHEDMIICKR